MRRRLLSSSTLLLLGFASARLRLASLLPRLCAAHRLGSSWVRPPRLGAASALPRLGAASAPPRIGSTSAACLDAASPPPLTLAAAAVAESCGGGKKKLEEAAQLATEEGAAATGAAGHAEWRQGCATGRGAAGEQLRRRLNRRWPFDARWWWVTGFSFSAPAKLLQSY